MLIIDVSIVAGLCVSSGAVSGERIDPSEKARALAEGIAEAMKGGALAFAIAVVGAMWLGFWTRRSRPKPV